MQKNRKTWKPTKQISKGATAYHEAVTPSSWHIDNITELVRIVQTKIKHGDVIVDFGAGTGGSAIYLLKQLKSNYKLWLVDNSESWLGKAYELLHHHPHVDFFHLGKTSKRYATLEETIGPQKADHILSANTFHLIPTLTETFKGIYDALKPNGTFTFQSGSIIRDNRDKGILILDNTVNKVHDIAIQIIRTNKKYAKYKKGLNQRIEQEYLQRKFVFPDPRHINEYVKILQAVGFTTIEVSFKRIPVAYKDWLQFLRVRRLQAGILPEVGGTKPTPEEEHDRDQLITLASQKLFKKLAKENPLADNTSFTAEWIYVTAKKTPRN